MDFKTSPDPENSWLSPKDRICRRIIEFGVIGLLVFSPLPIASVEEWAILVIQLTILVIFGAFLLIDNKLKQAWIFPGNIMRNYTGKPYLVILEFVHGIQVFCFQ